MSRIESIDEGVLERICDVLGDTSSGLTGSEIGRFLKGLEINDPIPGMTRRVRLFEALRARQRQDRCANLVIAFIQRVMEPVRYTGQSDYYERKRNELNEVLAFCGLSLHEDGKLRRQEQAACTLTEAEQRAGRLRSELRRRDVHVDVLAFCKPELLQKNYFHAVFEATKSVADKIRTRSGLTGDGTELVDHAFGSGKIGMPFLAFNTLQSDTERSEQSGLMNLMKGMFGAFRNVTAHAPKVSWPVTEQDALDLLTIASFLHRRLDAAARTPRTE
jgi:uncharacterized protein (TIGR02391 family)